VGVHYLGQNDIHNEVLHYSIAVEGQTKQLPLVYLLF